MRTYILILFFLTMPSANINTLAQDSLIDTIQNSMPSIVTIKAVNPTTTPPPGGGVVRVNYERNGAGVIIDKTGVIVTNAHIVQNARIIKVTFQDGITVEAGVLGVVPGEDVAFIKVDPSHAAFPIPMADSDLLKLSDDVVNVGNSELLKDTISGGIVSGLATNKSSGAIELIQTDLTLYKGDSGGPLLDSKGHLVGLMVARDLSKDRSSFAIPVNKIRKYVVHYLENK